VAREVGARDQRRVADVAQRAFEGILDAHLGQRVGHLARALVAPAAVYGFGLNWTEGLLLGAAVGTAGWLLFERAHSQAERNLFIAGSAALIGGTSAFLGLSPLLAGLMAGLVWVWLPGHADRVVRTDLRRVQHPLIVVLLLVAGASCEASVQAVWIAAPLVLFRFTGKLMGGWLAMRVQGLVTASELGLQLTAPGLLGIAVALHLAQAVRTQAAVTLLTAVVIATLASEALSLVLRPTDDR